MEDKNNNCEYDLFDFELMELPSGLWWNISYLFVVLLLILNIILIL